MVVLLITGPISSGKTTMANILQDKYGYKLHKIESCNFENLWNIDEDRMNENLKESVHKEVHDKLREALSDWKESHVLYPVIFSREIKNILLKRSYIKIVSITGPMLLRYKQFASKYPNISLEKFIEINDLFLFDLGVEECMGKSIVKITNSFNLKDLITEIDSHTLMKYKNFRPSWDHYFIKLAHVVKERSNCMKRSVGAIIVVGNRIASTGYNGVPGKLKNCYEGGCKRCNANLPQGSSLDECNCIHAEEAAVLEIGVHRAKGATLYTTLSPCRWCTKVIIAAGISRVVYDEKYTHEESEELLKESGITIECINSKI